MISARDPPRPRGFTLIEVLVALVIVAFGMGAVLATLTSAADNVTRMREKTFAEFIGATRAKIEHGFTGFQFGKGSGVAAAQGSFEGRVWHFAFLRRIVEV